MYAQVTALGLLAVYAYTLRNNWLYAARGHRDAVLAVPGRGDARRAQPARAHLVAHADAPRVARLAGAPTPSSHSASCRGCRRSSTSRRHALNTSPRTPDGLALDTLTAYGGGIAHGDVFLAGGVAARRPGAARLWHRCLRTTRAELRTSRRWRCWSGCCRWAWCSALGLRSGLFELRYLVLEPARPDAAGGAWHRAPAPTSRSGAARSALRRRRAGRPGRCSSSTSIPRSRATTTAAWSRRSSATPGRPTRSCSSAPNQVEIFDYYYHGAAADDRAARAAADRSRGHAAAARGDSRPVRPRLAGVVGDERGRPARGDLHLARRRMAFRPPTQWYGSVQLALVGFGSANATTEQRRHAARQRHRARGLSARLALAQTGRDAGADAGVAGRPAGRRRTTGKCSPTCSTPTRRSSPSATPSRPTTCGRRRRWQPGERIEDNYGIAIPADLAGGQLHAGDWHVRRRDAAPSFDGQGDHLVLGQSSASWSSPLDGPAWTGDGQRRRRVRCRSAAARASERCAAGRCCRGGRTTLNVLPWCGSLSAQMRPPWRVMISLLMYRPRPMPPVRRETGSSA